MFKGRWRAYKALSDLTNRLADPPIDDLGVKPGHRVLIRSANSPGKGTFWQAIIEETKN